MNKFLRNVAINTALALSTISLNVQSAFADHLNFTLYNDNDLSIWYLNVSRADSDIWSGDILGTDVLGSGEYTRVTFPYSTYSSPCIWDVFIVYSNATYDVTRQDLCQIDYIQTTGYGGDYIYRR